MLATSASFQKKRKSPRSSRHVPQKKVITCLTPNYGQTLTQPSLLSPSCSIVTFFPNFISIKSRVHATPTIFHF
ncbi:hypothetical protein QVD17_14787 [Tagetes erecta]|uniref:Uncharacterized protein n=1 Tax=Tagetes erecta TaxID=13708 RepID=A0AAD8KNK9_TARER|nr:hypothetical protein QVD17_14787 [Tagetes erecta]